MAITFDTFRNFAAQANVRNSKDIFISGADKSGLATRRDAGNRALAARDVRLAQTQDNVYLRGQLLAAVRNALGGENNNVFRNLQKMLFGITAENPAVNMEIASKPLKMRDVRVALQSVEIRLAQREVEAQLNARIDATFASPEISARNRDLIRGVLTKAMVAAQNADHFVSVETLTGPGSVFDMIKDLAKKPTGLMRTVLLAQSLPGAQIGTFLKARAQFGGCAMNYGIDRRLHAAMDQIATLPAKKFTPYNLFKIAFPTCTWPRELPKNGPITGTAADVAAFENAISKGQLGALMGQIDGTDPEAGVRVGGMISTINVMLDLGATVEDALRVLHDPTAFSIDMLAPGALRVGDLSPKAGVDTAFEQMMKDVVRGLPEIEIKGAEGTWRAPAAVTQANHPLYASAAQELRAKIDAVCGPNATDMMKSNVYLCMSQNAQAIDGAFNQTLGLGATGAFGIKYTVSADPDGSVVVKRSASDRNRYEISSAIRFFPDGSQRVEKQPEVRIRKDVSVEEVTARRTARMEMLAGTAKTNFRNFVQSNYSAGFVALFADEIAAFQKTYEDAKIPKEDYELRVGNVLCTYLAEPANAKLAKEILAMTPEARAAKLAELKPVLTNRVNVQVAGLALGVRAEHQAEEKIRKIVDTLADGHKVDLVPLRTKITYCMWTDQDTVESVQAKIDALRDAYVNDRRAVFDAVRALPDGEAFRNALLVDTMEHATLGRDDVLFAVDLARRLPVPAAGAALDNAGARAALMDIGASIASVFMTLDGERYGGDQRGNIFSLAVMYLVEQRHDEMQAIVGNRTAADLNAIDATFADGFETAGNFTPGSAGYVEAMGKTHASALIMNLRNAFNV